MIHDAKDDREKMRTILEVMTLAISSSKVPKNEVLEAFAEHFAIAIIGMSGDEYDTSFKTLVEAMNEVKSVFDRYWSGDLFEDNHHHFN